MPGNTCSFRGCHSKDGDGISMFYFPKHPEIAKLWIESCHRTDLLPKIDVLYKRYKLCELHFEAKYICRGSTRKRLFPNACPTIFPKREETNNNQERSSESH